MVGPWDMSYVNVPADPNGGPPEAIHQNHLVLLTVARKGEHSTDTVQPIQSQYRTTDEMQETFASLESAMQSACLPLIDGTYPTPKTAPYLVGVGKLGEGLADIQTPLIAPSSTPEVLEPKHPTVPSPAPVSFALRVARLIYPNPMRLAVAVSRRVKGMTAP
jgi:hypothetical protein